MLHALTENKLCLSLKAMTRANTTQGSHSMNGFQGQRVIIIPSKELVFVRLGFSGGPNRGIEELVAGVIRALAPD